MTIENQRPLPALQNTEFDILIIGGGITGAWTALDCARRGMKTALIDRGDFASATSSASSKLLHGGIRYLQQLEFNRVRESAFERAYNIYSAPHLSHYVPFVVPSYSPLKKSKAFLTAGMIAYKLLCIGENKIIEDPKQTPPNFHLLSKTQLKELSAFDDPKQTGAVVFYERHLFDTERTVLEILKTAKNYGAVFCNYVNAKGLITDTDLTTKVSGINAQDVLNGSEFQIKAKITINAAGPWVDQVNKMVSSKQKNPIINGFAKGSHIIIDRQISDHAFALTTQHKSTTKIDRGGRHIFTIPWRGRTLIGTSYDELNSPTDEVTITGDEINQLIDDVNSAIPDLDLGIEQIISGYSGIYPLHTNAIDNSVYQGSGEYYMVDHLATDGTEGLITALGAKYTTGRKIAELATDAAANKLAVNSVFQKCKLTSANYLDHDQFVAEKIEQYKEFNARLIVHLIRCYGSLLDDFMEFSTSSPALMEPVIDGEPEILGQAVWAVKHEMAVNLSDIIFRRTSCGFLGIQKKDLVKTANTIAAFFNWTEQDVNDQVNQVLSQLFKA